MHVKDRVAIVTGAGSGIGRATALELSRHGCTCVLVGRTGSRLEEALERVREHAPDSTVAVCDVSRRAEVNQTVPTVIERYGRVDILVNNAGIMTVKLFLDLSEAELDEHMAINYGGVVNFTRAVLPFMKERGQGAIVNVASVGGKLNLPGLTANTASKAAVYAFSESLYYELKGQGIHVAVILPGGTRTDLFKAGSKLAGYYCDQSTMAPERVAVKIREAVEKKRFESVVPLSNKAHIAFRGAFPGLFRRMIASRLRPYMD